MNEESIQTDLVTQKAKEFGFDDASDLASEISKSIKVDKEHIQAWRNEAKECYDFEASHQWSVDDLAKLEEQGRPAVVFNRVARTVNAVSGLEIQNRQEVRYIPRELGDVGVNELLTGAAQWARDLTDAEDEESESFRDLLVSGMGWTETRMDYEADEEGQIDISRIDPMEMGWDHGAKKKNLDDARRVWRAKEYSKKELEAEFPDADVSPNTFWPSTDGEEHLADEAWEYKNDQAESQGEQKYTVVHYQWWEKRTYYRVLSDSGRIVDLDHEQFEKVFKYIQAKQLRYQKMPKREFFQVFITGGVILDISRCPCNMFTLKCMTGIRDRNKNQWCGLVGFMRDPQRWANKWLSQMMHILNSNAKGGVLAEQGAFSDPRKAEDEWASSDTIIWLEEGGLAKIQEREMGQFPNTVDRLLQYALDAISDVVGVSSEFLGMTDTAQAAYLEHMRKQSGIALLATYFDGLRRYRKEHGRVLAKFIIDYISDGRLVRVAGEQGAQYVPLLKDGMTFKYDVIVDDAPTSPNQKEKVFGVMMQLLPIAVQAGIPIPPEILEYAPLPENITNKWKQMLQPQQDPMAEQAKMIQMQAMIVDIQKKVQDIEESKSKETLNYAKAESEGTGAVVDVAKARTEQQVAQVQAFKVGVDAANPNRGSL